MFVDTCNVSNDRAALTISLSSKTVVTLELPFFLHVTRTCVKKRAFKFLMTPKSLVRKCTLYEKFRTNVRNFQYQYHKFI